MLLSYRYKCFFLKKILLREREEVMSPGHFATHPWRLWSILQAASSNSIVLAEKVTDTCKWVSLKKARSLHIGQKMGGHALYWLVFIFEHEAPWNLPGHRCFWDVREKASLVKGTTNKNKDAEIDVLLVIRELESQDWTRKVECQQERASTVN